MNTSADSAARTREIFLYFTPLTLLVYLVLPHGYLLDIATSYMLKNQLHATATQVSLFRLFTALPVYLSIVFGFTRDLWNPFGLRDRGYFLLFGGITAVIFGWMSFADVTYAGLFAGMLLAMVSFRFVSAACQGLIALVGQEQLMSGRLSALWSIFMALPYVVGAFASGYAAEYLPPSRTFALVAVLALLIVAMGLWKPRAVFRRTYEQPVAQGADLLGDIRRLLKHRAIYPAVLLMFMFQFSPGSNTPLQFHLTNQLHASDAIYGYYYGVFSLALLPMFLLYGYLCKRVSLRNLLWWGIIVTIPQMVPLTMIHSGNEALFWAVPMGAMGGIASVAIYDLAMRSCPAGLQGTLMMLVDGMNQLSQRGGDLIGARIYNGSPAHGFLYCVILTTAVYALMLAVLKFVPKELIATADGEENRAAERAVLAEISDEPQRP